MKLLFSALTAAFVCCAAVELSAQEDVNVLKTKLAILEAEREASLKKMTTLRMKYINEDNTLKRMHDKIMDLHRNLAIVLDGKPEIREVNDKVIKLDSEIDSIGAKLKAADGKQAKNGKETKKGEK